MEYNNQEKRPCTLLIPCSRQASCRSLSRSFVLKLDFAVRRARTAYLPPVLTVLTLSVPILGPLASVSCLISLLLSFFLLTSSLRTQALSTSRTARKLGKRRAQGTKGGVMVGRGREIRVTVKDERCVLVTAYLTRSLLTLPVHLDD